MDITDGYEPFLSVFRSQLSCRYVFRLVSVKNDCNLSAELYLQSLISLMRGVCPFCSPEIFKVNVGLAAVAGKLTTSAP